MPLVRLLFAVLLFGGAELVRRASAAEVLQTNLVLQFSQHWQYQTNNLDNQDWWATDFDDATWPGGPALLYLETAELPVAKSTALPPRPGGGLPFYTYYFRTRFVLSNTPAVTQLVFSNLIDDGAVFYLNGQEVRRVSMAAGVISNASFATRDVGDATSFDVFALEGPVLAALNEGTNLLAVEVHQSTVLSSDVVFGTSLSAVQDEANPRHAWLVAPTNGAPSLIGAPLLAQAVVSPVFGPIARVEFFADGNLFATVATEPFAVHWVGSQLGPHSLFAVAHGSGGGMATSQVVSVLVTLPPPPKLTRGPYLQSGTPTGVTVRWRTDYPSTSRVNFGTNWQQLDQSVADAQFTTNHTLRLTNLSPATRYYYTVGSDAGDLLLASAQRYHLTSPPPGRPGQYRIWVIGDAGTGDIYQASVRNAYDNFIGTNHTDVWLQLGDNAYPLGTDAEFQRAQFNMYPGLLARTVTWPAVGNHDVAHAVVFTNAFPYFEIFDLPTQGEAGGVPSGFEHYYSFDYGNIHFIAFDSQMSSMATNSPMANWLRADLAANTNLWVIAYCHHPPYSKGSHDSDTELPLIQVRQNLLPILEAGGLDLFLAGHSHVYERTHLMNGNYSGTLFLQTNMIVMPGGGGSTNQFGPYLKPHQPRAANQGAVYVVMGSSGQITPGPLTHNAMHTAGNVLGSLYLEVSSNRLDAKFIRETGAIDDQFTILKCDMTNELAAPLLQGDGSLLLQGRGVPGRTYQIEATAELAKPEWQRLGHTRAETNGIFPFLDFGGTNVTRRFYRARQ